MTINIKLSTESIDGAINRLIDAMDNLEHGVNELVDILVTEGAMAAQSMYEGMAVVNTEVDGTEGRIIASGEAVGFAEFGAGDDTIAPHFENPPPFPVYPGSWSREKGSGEYAATGRWHFGGNVYQGIPARMGLLIAKEQIIGTASMVAEEVIRL